jgi:hypothetical protein
VIETLITIIQAFKEENTGSTRMLEWKGSNLPRPKKVRQMKSKANNMQIIFLHIKEIAH